MSTLSLPRESAEVISATSAGAARGHVIRTLRDDEHRAAAALMAGAFHIAPPSDAQWQQRAACYQSATDETTHPGRPAVAPPAPSRRRPSRRLDIGGVHVESQAVQVNLGSIRTFDHQVETIARANPRAGTPIRIAVHAGPLDKRLLARNWPGAPATRCTSA